MTVETRGIVLKESALGEKGKRLVIYTKDFGKITCFAKNVRKKNIAVATVLSYSDLKMYQNRDTYQLIDGTVLRSFEPLKRDIFKLSYSMYFLEFLDFVGREELASADSLKLLLYALRALENDKINDLVIKAVFELKMLQILGSQPELYNCVMCGDDEISLFSSIEGGVVCKSCKMVKDALPIDKDSLGIMRYILGTEIEKLFSFDLKDAQREKLEQILKEYIKIHLDYRFKTLDFIRAL